MPKKRPIVLPHIFPSGGPNSWHNLEFFQLGGCPDDPLNNIVGEFQAGNDGALIVVRCTAAGVGVGILRGAGDSLT